MEFSFKKYNPHHFIKSFAQKINLTSKTDCLEEVVELKNGAGEGKVTGFKFSDGIGLLTYDCTFNEDVVINFINDSPAPLQFYFSIEGEILHTLNNGDTRYILNPLQGTITSCCHESSQRLVLPGKRKVVFSILMIDRKRYLKKIDCVVDKMPDKLASVFTDVNAEKAFFYQGNYSLSASSCIKKILNDDNDGLVRSTFVEAKALELLSRQVNQFNDDTLNPEKQIMLRKYDIASIEAARDILINDLKNSPTIKELSLQAGINQQKLKKGFKIVFDSTINNYLRDERLERASLFLLKGFSVKEAAREVGYSNQSHFARRFKEKYGVLPKDYLKSVSPQN